MSTQQITIDIRNYKAISDIIFDMVTLAKRTESIEVLFKDTDLYFNCTPDLCKEDKPVWDLFIDRVNLHYENEYLKKEIEKLRAGISELTGKAENLYLDKQSLIRESKEFSSINNNLREQILAYEKELKIKNSQIQEATKTIAALQTEISRLQNFKQIVSFKEEKP